MTLDPRQRAMLREMGIRVWWPAEAETRAEAGSSPAGVEKMPAEPARRPTARSGPADAPGRPAAREAAEARAQNPRPPAGSDAPERAVEPGAPGSTWRIEPAQTLYSGDGPRWLLLSEQRPDSSDPALLEALLQAAGLHRGPAVWLAPLRRESGPQPVQGLEDALRTSEPDLVFIMGRLAAQALLENPAPLGQLRGQVHELWGLPAVVSYDCAALLRHSPDKAKAWDDLCLAVQVARQQHEERRESQ